MRILHITDFHIDNPTGDKENLREGFYQEFIDRFHSSVSQAGLGKIDLLINTGDFVNIGKTENFDHAKQVLDYTINKFGVESSQVAVAIGNHDFKLKEPGTLAEKRAPFLTFSDGYSPGAFLGETQHSKLFHNNELKVQILIIDNASREDDINEPIVISIHEQDNIIKLVRDHALERDLIVVSHYPMVAFPMAKYPTEDADWVRNHVWKEGFNISDRLSQAKAQGKVVFLCGDGHIPDAFQVANTQFIMTGMLGGNYEKRDFHGKPFFMQTQARIFEFEENSRLWTFNYKPKGFDYDASNGIWNIEESSLRSISESKSTVTEVPSTRTTVLSAPLEFELLERIKKEKLYKLGRFVTSPESTALCWISMNRLFEEQQLFVNLIDKTLDWLAVLNAKSSALIVGVGFYGAMIGAHISVRTAIKNVCLQNEGHDEPLLCDGITNAINAISGVVDVIFISDVVSSGHSILRIIKELEENYQKKIGTKLTANYHSISVISDIKIVRKEFDDKMKSIKTACGSLPMPVVETNQLPDFDILSPRIDLTK